MISRPAAVLTLFAAGCASKPAAPPAAAAPGPAVTVARVEKKAVARTVEQPGAVEPWEETRLFAKLPGFVRAIGPDAAAGAGQRIDIGSRVQAGQLLAELDIPELDEEANQKAAVVRQADAEVEQARKALAAAEAGVASAAAAVAEAEAGVGRASALLARWQSEAARVVDLVRTGVVDAGSRDETQNQLRAAEATRAEAVARVASARAAVAKAKADRDRAAADVAADEARREVAKADAARVAALVGYGKIVSPFDGIVTRRAVSTGDYLPGGGKDGVFAVARVDPVRVVVHVPEADAGLVAAGTPVRVTIPALGGPDLVGTVARTSWALAAGSRTLRAEIDAPNPDARLRPGMYATAKLTATFPEAWAVPAAAVGKAGDDAVVYLAEGGKAVRTPVQLGRGDGTVTQVRRYRRPGAADWTDFAGTEAVATPAALLTDGQQLPAK